MRRETYFNNRKIRRQAKKVICIATLSATMLTSIPFVTYTDAYAKGQTTLEEMKALSMPTENAITYDLSDASLLTDKTVVDCFGEEITEKVIEINITKNGNYIITGNNEINGALIDTRIDQRSIDLVVSCDDIIPIFCNIDLNYFLRNFFPKAVHDRFVRQK